MNHLNSTCHLWMVLYRHETKRSTYRENYFNQYSRQNEREMHVNWQIRGFKHWWKGKMFLFRFHTLKIHLLQCEDPQLECLGCFLELISLSWYLRQRLKWPMIIGIVHFLYYPAIIPTLFWRAQKGLPWVWWSAHTWEAFGWSRRPQSTLWWPFSSTPSSASCRSWWLWAPPSRPERAPWAGEPPIYPAGDETITAFPLAMISKQKL